MKNRRIKPELIRILAYIVLYNVVAKLTMLLTETGHGDATFMWPSIGISLAATLRYGYVYVPATIVAEFLVGFSEYAAFPPNIFASFATGFEVSIITYLLRNRLNFSGSPARLANLSRLVIGSGFGILANCISLLIIGAVLSISDLLDTTQNMLLRSTGNFLGYLCFTPLLLMPFRSWEQGLGIPKKKARDFIVPLLALCVAISPWLSYHPGANSNYLVPLGIYILLLWSAVSLPSQVFFLVLAMFGCGSICVAHRGFLPILSMSTNSVENIGFSQVLLVCFTLLAMLLHVTSVEPIVLENAKLYAELEKLNKELELRIEERTRELKDAQQTLLETAHRAGMAEIATGAVHNIGNTLNSVGVSLEFIREHLKKSELETFIQGSQILKENQDSLVAFTTQDPKGILLLRLFIELGSTLKEEHSALVNEAQVMTESMKNIKEIVLMQQAYASQGLHFEDVSIREILDGILKLEEKNFTKENIQVQKSYDELPVVLVQKNKLFNVIVNLFKNAREAMIDCPKEMRLLRVHALQEAQAIKIEISDAGIGIASENLAKLFRQGFTTKGNGHGFGLHSAANAMAEMGGSIRVESAGLGKGATFTVVIPKSNMKRETV